LAVLPVYVSSLKDPVSAATVEALFDTHRPDVVLNLTGFAVSAPGADRTPTVLERDGAPVIQVVLSGSPKEVWEASPQGLNARDLAMNVALPEVDGRVLSRAVSFKSASAWDAATECNIVTHEPVADRVEFVAELAARWVRLRRKPAAEKRIALVLANYPNRDGRIGNGVGLDTPAGTMTLLRAMTEAGYTTGDLPADGNALVDRLLAGPTNAAVKQRIVEETISLADYQVFLSGLPAVLRAAVTDKWGAAEADPFYLPGEADCGAFAIPAFRCGNIAGRHAAGARLQYRSRRKPITTRIWCRRITISRSTSGCGFSPRRCGCPHGQARQSGMAAGQGAGAVGTCFPEAVLGPVPHIYPFIVNDPGEGTQAKRRASAVIIDHLTPPLTRAESYGPLADLERLVDEYYEAAGVDPRRLGADARNSRPAARGTGSTRISGSPDDGRGRSARAARQLSVRTEGTADPRRAAYFRRKPGRALLRDLAGRAGAPAARRRAGRQDQSPDPRACRRSRLWTGSIRWTACSAIRGPADPGGAARRRSVATNGDTVERLELLALGPCRRQCAGGRLAADACGAATDIGRICARGRGLRRRGNRRAADGARWRFRRARPVRRADARAARRAADRAQLLFRRYPHRADPTAWTLGWKSATLLVERYVQDHGEWPRRMALSAWGTSNMRTGGDDIAQAWR
jgi:cobaltochelatase CobN